jgi:hypothetical protein
MACDPVLDEVVSSYLRLVDAEAPDLVEGLYLVGSAALGDFDPAISDIDYVAVTASRPDPSAIAALARVHRRLRRVRRRPTFDGVYVTWTDLSADPLRVQSVPGSHEGRFAADAGGRDPIAWHTLARYGVASRGPAPTALNVWTDTDALAAWTDDNLDRYWKRLLERSSRQYTPFGVYALTDYATVWSVTGLARLHYTLATGDITSKTGAAQHALDTFPSQWHPILWESLRIRAGDTGRSMYHTRIDRRRDVLAFGQMAIEEGHRLYATRG